MPDAQPLRPLEDDPEHVPDTESVLRVIRPGYYTGDRFHTNAFEDHRLEEAHARGLDGYCMSENRRKLWEGTSGDIAELLRRFPPGAALAEIPVAALRGLRTSEEAPVPQGVMPDPIVDAPWHAVVFSINGGKRTKGAQKAIVKVARWFWRPT